MLKDNRGIFVSFDNPKPIDANMIKILGIVAQGLKIDAERTTSWAIENFEGKG